MIGRFNTDNKADVSVQLFGQEIINLRKREQIEQRNNKSESGRWYEILYYFNKFILPIYLISFLFSIKFIHCQLKFNLH